MASFVQAAKDFYNDLVKDAMGGDLDADVIDFRDYIFAGKTVDFNSHDKAGSIFRALSKMPNGARGELEVTYSEGGGHSMAWEIVNNKPAIFDFQAYYAYENSESFQEFASYCKDARVTRLDNIDLNMDFLKRWVKSAK